VATVLIVDDRPASREIARATLDHGGHRILEAGDARKALAMLGEAAPDLVIADVLMPGMDGYGFAQELRSNPATAHIPVLFYTANYRPEEAGPLAEAYGVAAVLSKSADPLELLAAVDDALQHRPQPLADAAVADLAVEHLKMVNTKLMEKTDSLHESQERLAAIAEMSPVGIVLGTASAHATYVNPRLTEIAGVPGPDLLGTNWLRCLPPNRRNDVLDPAADGPDPLRCRGHLPLGDGAPRWLDTVIRHVRDSDGRPVGFVAVIDDVTSVVEADKRQREQEKEREAEARRRISERLDSLARLSNAVAHDFNNLLNIILSFSEFVDEAISDAVGERLTGEQAAAINADLGQIGQAGRRAAHLAHQLLTFGGREVMRPTAVDVNAIVREVHDMIGNSIGRHLAVSTDLDPGLRPVRADGPQLCQALLNVAHNARDAMPRGGSLMIRTGRACGTDPDDGVAHDLTHIEVIDTGEGMTPEVAQRAMEPFFTTRPKGHGTGLGLATAYGIVRQAGGEIDIESTVGVGTTVHIYLPATDQQPEAVVPAAATEAAAGRTILVVDDEDGVREVACRILTGARYLVLAAANGEEALAVADGHDGTIHAVITDVVMPRMNGAELARALRTRRPTVPVLYMSGYAAPLMTEQGLLEPGVTVLSKPFTKSQLLDATLAILASGP
jgi:two-component system, cell cycle sensor histidine kinase and response regulator CckA